MHDNARADLRYGTVPKMVRANAKRFGERDAVVDGHRRMSFVDVEQEMLAVSHGA